MPLCPVPFFVRFSSFKTVTSTTFITASSDLLISDLVAAGRVRGSRGGATPRNGRADPNYPWQTVTAFNLVTGRSDKAGCHFRVAVR